MMAKKIKNFINNYRQKYDINVQNIISHKKTREIAGFILTAVVNEK